LNALAAFACALTLSTNGAGEEHLVSGAAHFREGRYAEALVEFRVAEKLGVRQASAYSGASLVKLERFEEAIEAFGSKDGAARDALIDYYRALACYGARLYVCADETLVRIGERSGPKLAGLAATIRADVAAKLAMEPTPVALQWYATRCAQRRSEGRAILAQAYCAEASALAKRSPPKAEGDPAGTSKTASGDRP